MHLITLFVRRGCMRMHRPAIVTKTLRIMKLVTLLLTVCCLQLSATIRSQSVTLSVRNAPVEAVLTEIKKQTGYSIIWDERQLETVAPVSMQVKNASLEDVLKKLLTGQSLSYQVIGKMIVIKNIDSGQKEDLNSELYMPPFSVTGVVQTAEGEPIPGASIQIKNSRTGVTSAANGRFTIQTNIKDSVVTLMVSSLGYVTREVSARNEQKLFIVLQKSEAKLEELVISTGVFDRKKENYTGAVTTVTAEELARYSNRNLLVALRNIDPAFNIIESNITGSDPNIIPDVQIRGNSNIPNVNEIRDQSLGMNNPLIILDGFESTMQRLLDMNQNEVESLTILKDASATAIYGSRGANGVIVIKTRLPKGGRGGKIRIGYRSDVSFEVPDLTSYNLLKSGEKLELERMVGLYDGSKPDREVSLKEYYSFLLNEINRGVETDWLSKPLRTAIGQKHNLRLEGGDQNFRYSLSANLNDIPGAMKGSFRRTFNGNVMLTYNHKNLRFQNNIQIALGRSQNSPYGSFADYAKMNPYWAPYDQNGNPYRLLGDPGSNIYAGRWFSLPGNPLYNAVLNSFDKASSTGLTNNFSVEWKMNKGFILRGRLGVSKGESETDKFLPANHTSFAQLDILRRGTYDYGTSKNFQYDVGINLTYSRQFNKHSLFIGADYNLRESTASSYLFKVEGFNHPNFDFLTMGLQYAQNSRPQGAESITRTIGLTSSVNYTYDDRYFIDLTERYDGSSQFGELNRFAPFWSIGVGWNLHKEDFLKNNTIIKRLKLRGSMGTTGSQDFKAYQALQTYRYVAGDRYYSWVGAQLIELGNERLRWQQKTNYNVGLEGDFFNSRLLVTSDFYIETTNGLISSVDLPASNGFSRYIDNIGKLENKGMELKVTYHIVPFNPKRGFAWSVMGSVFHNRNKIIQISQALKDAQKDIETAVNTSPDRLYKEGYSSNTIWVVPSLGIDPSTGKEIYIDNEGNPTLTWSSMYLKASGIGEPKYRGAVNTTVRYKFFSMTFSLAYRTGGQVYNSTLIEKVETGNYQYNMDSRVFESRWKQPGDKAAFKGLLVTIPTYKTSRFVQNESSLQMQNVNFQYDFKQPFVRKMGLQNFSIAGDVAEAFFISTIRRERGTSYPFAQKFSLTLNAVF